MLIVVYLTNTERFSAYETVNYWCSDESRFGLHTRTGRIITSKGTKAIGYYQWSFKAFWLYGAVAPGTGESFFWQFSHFDTDCYQQFLEYLSQAYPKTLIILQVDNGRPHTAKKLVVPENIILLFQPPYSPELNPIERLWQALKQDLKWELFSDLDELHCFLDRALKKLTPKFIVSVCGYSFILDALSVANIY